MVKHRCKQKEKGLNRVLLILVILLMNITAKAQTLSLEQCIDTALIYNRNIKLSQHDVEYFN